MQRRLSSPEPWLPTHPRGPQPRCPHSALSGAAQPALGTELRQPLLPSVLPAAWPLAVPDPLSSPGVALARWPPKPPVLSGGHREAEALPVAAPGLGDGARLPKEGPWGLGLTNEPEGCLSHGGLRAPQVGLAVPHKLLGPAAVLGQLQGAQGCGQYSEGLSWPDQPLLPAPPWLRALPHAGGRKGRWA